MTGQPTRTIADASPARRDPGPAPDREQAGRPEPVRRDDLAEVEPSAGRRVGEQAIARGERAPQCVQRVPRVGAEVRRERDGGRRADGRRPSGPRPGRGRPPRRAPRRPHGRSPGAGPFARRPRRRAVRRSRPGSPPGRRPSACRWRPPPRQPRAAASGRARYARTGRPPRRRVVASAIDSVSDIATALDCQSWPGSAAITAASDRDRDRGATRDPPADASPRRAEPS